MSLIRLTNVFVKKSGHPVLHGLSWEIKAGEQWAVTGPNGSGKTVLLETLAGRLVPHLGSIEKRASIEMVAADYSYNRIVRAAAQYYQQRYFSQDAALAPTVREVLTNQLKPVGTVNDASVTLAPPDVSPEKLEKIVTLLSLSHLLDQPFVTLSNGETRRMLLATALVRDSDVLMFDFPFTGLDTYSREVLKRAMKTLIESGKTLIITSKAIEIPDFVTNVLELDEGKIRSMHPIGNGTTSDPEISAGLIQPPVSLDLLRQLGEPYYNDFQYAFKLRRVTVSYDGKRILDGVDWEVKKGERWALSGPNGSGKSTLLSLITADHPQRFANDFEIFDRPKGGRGFSMWDIKQRIGHVSPELHMYFPPETTVFKTIGSGFFDATGIYFKKLTQDQEDQIRLVARVLNVDDLLEETFKHLSRGIQRLVLLARALVKNPPLLILDEPCQGLDRATTEYFKSVVDTLCRNSSYTLIYVSHYPDEIPSCVTRHLKLGEGRVVAD